MHFLLQIHGQVLHDGGQSLLDSLIASITAERSSLEAIRTEKDLALCMERLNGASVRCFDLLSDMQLKMRQFMGAVCCLRRKKIIHRRCFLDETKKKKKKLTGYRGHQVSQVFII